MLNYQSIILKKFYTLVEIEPSNNMKYKYQLLNKNDDTIFEDTTFRLPPSFSFIDNNIIRVRIGAGTNVYNDRFYDILNNKLSEYFLSPYTTLENMAASININQEEIIHI